MWCKTDLQLGLASLLALCAVQAQAQTFEPSVQVLPAQPRAQQAVYARATIPVCTGVSDVRHAQGVISIGIAGVLCIPQPGTRDLEVSLGKLPQGEYRVRLVNADNPARPALTSDVVFNVAAPPAGQFFDEFDPLLDYSGWWWNAASAGEGWFVERKVPDRLMLSWATYDTAGRATWLVMQSDTRSYRRLSGPVYGAQRVSGAVTLTRVGQGVFEASAANTATFTLTPDGPSATPVVTSLQRLPF